MSNHPASTPEIRDIGQIALTVSELERAVSFYRDVLGISFLFRASNMAFFDCGGVRLMLTVPEGPDAVASSIIYYRVDDLPAAHAAIRGRGAEFETEPHLVASLPDHELWMSFLRDTEGNVLALMSEVTK